PCSSTYNPHCSPRSQGPSRRPRTGLKVASTRHYARCCYRTGACGWHDANAPWNGGCNNTPTPQHPCTRSSSNSTTTLACEPNQFPKNPSARRSMIAPSQPKKASAFNEDGKDSNPTRHAGARHTFLPITPIALAGRVLSVNLRTPHAPVRAYRPLLHSCAGGGE